MAGIFGNQLPPGLAGYVAAEGAANHRNNQSLQNAMGVLSLQQMLDSRNEAMRKHMDLQGILPQLTDPGARMLASTGDYKGAISRQFPDQGARFGKIDPKDYSADSVAKFAQSGNFGDLAPVRKGEAVTTTDAQGRPMTQFVNPFDSLPALPQPVRREMVNLGGTVSPVDPYTQTSPLARTVSPDSQLQANVALRGQGMTDLRARDANQIEAGKRLDADTTSLRKEFNDAPEVKKFRTVQPIISSARNAPDTGAGDLDLIYAVGKVLDPESVVREGELALTIKSGSPMERFKGQVRYITEGKGRLTPQTRSELTSMLDNRVGELERGYTSAKTLYSTTAQRRGLPAEQIFMDDTFGRRGSDGRPRSGDVIDGYTFKGGDPSKRENWERR